MDDEEVAFEIILSSGIEVEIREKWSKKRILRPLRHSTHDLAIGIRIDERIMIDFIVGCPEFGESDEIIFGCLDSNSPNIIFNIFFEIP